MKPHNKALLTVVLVFVVCVMVYCADQALGIMLSSNTDAQLQSVYLAWCKLAHRDDITYTEWKKLKTHGLLTTVPQYPPL